METVSDGLFDIGNDAPATVSQSPLPVRDEQVAAIRSELDEAGILRQEDRQSFVESVILESVDLLRDLTAVQARRVLDQLRVARSRPKSKGRSLGDSREEDTRIDRL